VRPEALRQIESAGLSTDGLRSKSWEEFTRPEAAHLSFVFTVCDNAAKEVAYKQAFAILNTRISLMFALPLSGMDSLTIKKEIDSIGRQ
jgi:arsenate reductase